MACAKPSRFLELAQAGPRKAWRWRPSASMGFCRRRHAVIGEQDILGDRLVRARKKTSGDQVLQEVGALSAGDLVVHVDHGIGRFVGLTQIQAGAFPTTASNCIMPAATSSSCRSKISSCCRATVRKTPERNSTSSAASPGRRARRG